MRVTILLLFVSFFLGFVESGRPQIIGAGFSVTQPSTTTTDTRIILADGEQLQNPFNVLFNDIPCTNIQRDTMNQISSFCNVDQQYSIRKLTISNQNVSITVEVKSINVGSCSHLTSDGKVIDLSLITSDDKEYIETTTPDGYDIVWNPCGELDFLPGASMIKRSNVSEHTDVLLRTDKAIWRDNVYQDSTDVDTLVTVQCSDEEPRLVSTISSNPEFANGNHTIPVGRYTFTLYMRCTCTRPRLMGIQLSDTFVAEDGSYYMYVSGEDFAEDSEISLYVGEYDANPQFITRDKVMATLPSICMYPALIILNVDGKPSRNALLMGHHNLPIPKITSIDAPPTFGGTITVMGRWIQTAPVSVTIGDRACNNIKLIDSKTFTCMVEAGTGSNISVSAIFSNGITTGSFSYLPPSINSLGYGNTAGSRIEINGTNFGRNASAISVKFGDNEYCSSVQLLEDHFRISCLAPAGSGSNIKITLDVSGQSTISNFTYMAPIVSRIDSPAMAGDEIFIYGDNFGIVDEDVSVVIGSKRCQRIIVNNHTSIQCLAPPGINKGITVDVTVKGISGSAQDAFSYQPPQITSTVMDGSYLLVVSGSNLGSHEQEVRMTINGVPCINMRVIVPYAKFTCQAAEGHGSVEGMWYVGNQQCNTTVYYSEDSLSSVPSNEEMKRNLGYGISSYSPPHIILVSSPPTLGGRIIIQGNNLGNNEDGITIMANNASCTSVQVIHAGSSVACTVTAGTGLGSMTIKVGNLQSTGTFLYRAPTIQKASITGRDIIISGNNFGDDITKMNVKVADQDYDDITLLAPHKRISVKISSFAQPNDNNNKKTYSLPISLSVGDQTAFFTSAIVGHDTST
ncbi:cell surface receptor IPT/TIG domain-containing protein [Planoprotostelium fungivorum]|uniref:Cell surface receptor IPT/TIG domain-containing protein n=1 Tax=Planoprotostelium fungivorum TaxID=1890364 RepID=A0A2P6N889_9EUKA|nr:cell surface receptor IPT/TIG domain-containing protein [Planoprotostelium fungivorum]